MLWVVRRSGLPIAGAVCTKNVTEGFHTAGARTRRETGKTGEEASMSVHLIKLCVGIDSVTHLQERQAWRLAQQKKNGQKPELFHRTRQMPRRRDDVLDGGSLYWVIKGVVLVRQRIIDLREVRGDDGIRRCDIVLEKTLVPTRPRPRRAFQGWRYLHVDDAPKDLGSLSGDMDELSPEMRSELLELGLI